MALSNRPLSMITLPAREAPVTPAPVANKPAADVAIKAKGSKPKVDTAPTAPAPIADAMAAALATMAPDALAALLVKAGLGQKTEPAKVDTVIPTPVGKVGTLPAPKNAIPTLASLKSEADSDTVTSPLAGYIGQNVLVTQRAPLGNRTLTFAASVVAIERVFISSKGRTFPAPKVWCYNNDHGIGLYSPTQLGELDTAPDAPTLAAGIKQYAEAVASENHTGTITAVYKSGAEIKLSDGRKTFVRRDGIRNGVISEGSTVHFVARRCDIRG